MDAVGPEGTLLLITKPPLSGWGFLVLYSDSKRQAKNGEKMTIKATIVPGFSAGKAFKEKG